MDKQFIGVDIGTSACKAAAFDEDGTVLAQANRPYPVSYPAAGWAEQDPEAWWAAACDALGDVLRQGAVDPAKIRGVGVDGQSWSAVAVDEKGRVLAPAPIWMDTRARDICERVSRDVGGERIFSVAGNSFLPSYATPKMLWFKEERPEVFARTYKFLQSNSFIVLRLTGVMSQDLSQGYGIHFFDMQKLSYDGALAHDLGLSTDLAPPLYACDAVVGTVTEAAAARTGLLPGTPVVAGGLDAACGALGAGVYKAGQTQEQGGQAGGMSICTDRAVPHEKLILSPHVAPGMWLLQGGTVGGGGALRWFRQELGQGMRFDQLTAEAEQVPPGADGLLFLPYMAGERSPIWDPDAKGVFCGLSFGKTRGHMVRAILEGAAFSLEHNLRVAAETGVEVDVLNAMGGASNSVLWTQIKADVTGRRMQVPGSDTATALGAALLAAVGCGVYRDYGEAVSRTIRITRVQEPDWANHEKYQRYMELYLKLYEDLKADFPLFV